MDEPLNGVEVMNIVGHRINCVPFQKIKNLGVEELFQNGCLLINYLSSPNMGHWCCLVKVDNRIYYFNPTGRFIDETLELIPEEMNKLLGQTFPDLLLKLYKSNYEVSYSDEQLQEKNTNSCGRWCGLFMRMIPKLAETYNNPEEEFIKMFKGFSNSEVVELTNLIADRNKMISDELINSYIS